MVCLHWGYSCQEQRQEYCGLNTAKQYYKQFQRAGRPKRQILLVPFAQMARIRTAWKQGRQYIVETSPQMTSKN